MELVFDGIVYSLQRYGGISNYFTSLLNNLKHTDEFNFKLMLYGNPQLTSLVTTKKIQNKYRLFERYKKVTDIPDNAILHSSYYRISKSKKVTNVITLYDFTYEKYTNGMKSVVHKRQKKIALKKADVILCISENTKRDLLYYYPTVNSDNVFVTYLSAGDEFRSMNVPFENRMNSPFVLFVGSRAGYKNFKTVVEAISIVHNVSLSIIGGGKLTDKERAHLDSKLPKRYNVHSAIDGEGLNKLYNKALCLVYPSLYEGFGIPILEAMRAGCPVICNNVSSIPEVAGNSAIILQECNFETISHSIKSLFEEKVFTIYQNKGFENSLRFSWDKTAKQTLDIYKSFMKK